MRHNGRATDQMRIVSFERNYTRHAAGSVLAEFGDTKVICTAVVEVPRFLKGKRGGLPLSMECYRRRQILGMIEKRSEESKTAAL